MADAAAAVGSCAPTVPASDAAVGEKRSRDDEAEEEEEEVFNCLDEADDDGDADEDDEDEGENDDDDDEPIRHFVATAVKAKPTAGAGAGAGAAAAPAPAARPAKKAKAAARVPVLTTPVSITITGGEGVRVTSGKATGSLALTVVPATVTLGELKGACRRAFGKAPSQRQAAFAWAGAAGEGRGAFAPKKLFEGAQITCTYSFAGGNLGALLGGRRGFGFGGGRRCAFAGFPRGLFF